LSFSIFVLVSSADPLVLIFPDFFVLATTGACSVFVVVSLLAPGVELFADLLSLQLTNNKAEAEKTKQCLMSVFK
jgi:hypothetical protein